MNFMSDSAKVSLRLEAHYSHGVTCDERDLQLCVTSNAGHAVRSGARSARVGISNRQWPVRLEMSATLTKQTPEAVSNRHNREGLRTFPGRLIQVQRCTQNADGEMRQVRSVVVELDPTNHAVILQVLRNLCFSDSQMFGKLGLQPAVRHRTALPRSLRRTASRTSRQISQSHPQSLASFHVV